MSLTKEAIVRIEELTAAGNKIENTWTTPVALPSGVTIHDLEQYQEFRYQFRGQMRTESISDFIEYCNNQGVGQCFIGRGDMSAKTIFDIGTLSQPGHCKHSASIDLKPTAAYLAFNEIIDKRLDQKALAEFLEDWRDSLRAADDNEENISIIKAIAAVRKVTVKAKVEAEHKVNNYSSSVSGLDQLDATSGEDSLPAFIAFSLIPFEGLTPYIFELRINLNITSEKPLFILRPIMLGDIKEKIGNEFRDIIKRGLVKEIPSFMGYFKS